MRFGSQPGRTRAYDAVMATLVDSSGTQLHCTCPYSRRMKFNWGVAYCSHIQATINQRRDEIADLPLAHAIVVTSSPPPLSRPFALQFAISPPDPRNAGQREVRLLELDGESLGFIPSDGKRQDVIELAVPYLVEWYYDHPCSRCGAIESMPNTDSEVELLDAELRIARTAAERLARQPQELCAECRSLIPEVTNDRKYPAKK